jgi:hypothetical protein
VAEGARRVAASRVGARHSRASRRIGKLRGVAAT